MKQGMRTIDRYSSQSTNDPHAENHEEKIDEICEEADKAVECTIKLKDIQNNSIYPGTSRNHPSV